MFNQYPESKDFSKIILPCLADKRVYKSITATTNTNLAIIKIPTKQFKSDPALLFGAESTISGTIVFEKGAGATGPYFSYIDGNAYSLFRRVRILSGSTVISDINNYAQYIHCENDMTMSPFDKYHYSVLSASNDQATSNQTPTVSITLPATYTPGVVNGAFTNLQALQNDSINSSQLGYSPVYNGSGIAYIPFTINLKNFLGNAIDHPIPLHLISKNDLILEIELETCDNFIISDNTGDVVNSISICELQYNAVITKIPISVSNLLFPGNETTLLGIDKRNDVKFVQGGSTTINIQYDNFKYRDVRSIIFFFQNFSDRNDQTKVFITQRSKGYISSYNLMYNNRQYPNNKIDNVSQMFDQCLKCFNSKKSCLSYSNYSYNSLSSVDLLPNVLTTEYLGPDYSVLKKFIGGVSLQRYHSDDKHFNGTNLSETSLTLNGDFNIVNFNLNGTKTLIPTGIGISNCYLISYCIYDVTYKIRNGEIEIIY